VTVATDEIYEKYLQKAITEINALGDEVAHAAAGTRVPVVGSGHPLGDIFLLKHDPTAAELAEGVAFYGNTPASDMAGGTTAFSSYVYVSHGVTDTATGFNDDVARLLGAQRTGATTLSLRVNGTQTATNTVPSMDVDEVGVGARIGASGPASSSRASDPGYSGSARNG